MSDRPRYMLTIAADKLAAFKEAARKLDRKHYTVSEIFHVPVHTENLGVLSKDATNYACTWSPTPEQWAEIRPVLEKAGAVIEEAGTAKHAAGFAGLSKRGLAPSRS